MKALTLFTALALVSSAGMTTAQQSSASRDAVRRERDAARAKREQRDARLEQRALRGSLAELGSLADLQSLGDLGSLKELTSLSSLQSLQGLESLRDLKSLEGLGSLAELGSSLSQLGSLGSLGSLADLGDRADLADRVDGRRALRSVPPAPWAQGDPADSLYRAAREALNDGDYRRAATLFRRVTERFPRSEYAGTAMYYQAYSLYRSGRSEDLEDADRLLVDLRTRYPRASTAEASNLQTRICGELARRGDAKCAAEITKRADPIERPEKAEKPERPERAEPPERTDRSTTRSTQRGSCPDEDDDDRVAALNALLQMQSEQALPMLKKVLERREPCSVQLRRKAVFLVSQKRGDETVDILLNAAKNDPDREVREQAVFWLGQTGSERAVDVLQDLLKNSGDEAVKDKAIFALSQHRSSRASQTLRDYAGREGESEQLREQAIFWLGQRHSEETATFLKGLYGRLREEGLKEKVIFSLSQQRGFGNPKWIMDIALDKDESTELRKKALFWAGQTGAAIGDLVTLYDRMTDHEMRNQLIFVYSQRRERAAVDKLFDIARSEKDKELKKQAIFWLGQSRDARAPQFLLDLIEKRPEGER